MPTTGLKFPTSGVNVSAAPWSDDAWVNPGNITASGSFTSITAPTYDAGDQSQKLRATGFDFSVIPDNSTIDGIIVYIYEVDWAAGTASLDLCQLVNGGTSLGANRYATPQAVTSTPTTYTRGAAADLWSATLTSAIVKSSTFGVDIGMIANSANTDVYIGYVQMEVYYTPPAPQSLTATPVDSFTAIDTDTKLLLKAVSDNTVITDTSSALVDKAVSDSVGFLDELTYELILGAPNIIYRDVKGTALTHEEIDANLTYLNTKIERAVTSIVQSGATVTPVPGICFITINDTATINAPSGTPTDGLRMLLSLKASADYSWDAIYRPFNGPLPTNITAILSLIYNEADGKWDVITTG